LARTIYIQCIHGIFGRGITKYMIIYGVYVRFWLTVAMRRARLPCDFDHVIFIM